MPLTYTKPLAEMLKSHWSFFIAKKVGPNPYLAFMLSVHLLFVSTRLRGPFLGPERVSRVVRGTGMVPAEEGRVSVGARSGLGRRVAVPRP